MTVSATTNSLFAHQRQGLEFLRSREWSGMLVWDPGCGKTRAVIEAFCASGLRHMVVVAPLSILESTWGEDLERWAPGLTWGVGMPKRRWPDVVLINYERMRIESVAKALARMADAAPSMIVLDESTRIKAHNTKTTKFALALAGHYQARVCLSGTPTPNSDLEWWAQVNFVEPWALGSSFHKFKSVYFHMERNGDKHAMAGQVMSRELAQKMFSSGWKLAITPQSRAELMTRVGPRIHVVKKSDALPDLPEKIDRIRTIRMTDPQRSYYRRMERDMVLEIQKEDVSDLVVARNILTKMQKLRQITSGFAISDNGAIPLCKSPKIAELIQIAEDCAGQQLVIWGHYLHELREVVRALGPENCSTLWSETTEREESVRQFVAGKTRFMVAHPASAAHGLNWQNASVQVFMSLSYSAEQYEQARNRTHRPGQKNPCVYQHLICPATVDEDMLRILRGKLTAQDAILAIRRRQP